MDRLWLPANACDCLVLNTHLKSSHMVGCGRAARRSARKDVKFTKIRVHSLRLPQKFGRMGRSRSPRWLLGAEIELL